MNYTEQHLQETAAILEKLDVASIVAVVQTLAQVRNDGGRVFFLGVGGGAANCSHAVNDFRMLAGIECYAPTDNAAELTARINDEGWDNAFAGWLKVSRLSHKDAVCVFSVGGGDAGQSISANLVVALMYAQRIGARIVGICGRDGGYTAQVADACVIVPTVNPDRVTPHTEAFQAIIWHLLVSHPLLKAVDPKWESVTRAGAP